MSVKDKVEAIDRFVRTIKESGVYDDIGTACIMAGWTNLAGAITPLKGTAPTNNGFLAADLDAGIGLKGDGSSYIDSNRANNADGQDDQHASAYVSSQATATSGIIGSRIGGDETGSTQLLFVPGSGYSTRVHAASPFVTALSLTGFYGAKRSSAASFDVRIGAGNYNYIAASQTPNPENVHVFRRSGTTSNIPTDATLSWYSIGTSTDLAALDSAVSTLMADLRSIDEAGFDPSALNYIRAVEAADGAYLETGVKKAINRFIVGLKKDNLWDALKASCILCGARTIAGALVPLAGTAPTAYNFTSANYNRETGLLGVPASSTYIDTNRANNADGQDDNHNALYYTYVNAASAKIEIGAGGAGAGANNFAQASGTLFIRSRSSLNINVGTSGHTGLAGFSRSSASQVSYRANGSTGIAALSSSPASADSVYVFARNNGSGVAEGKSDPRLAFYSIGSSLDLAALDARVTTLVSEIAAAIP